MNKASQVEPIFIGIVFPDGFSSLQQVLNLRLIQVRITIIYNIIEKLTAFPYAHLYPVQFPIRLSHLLHLHAFAL